MSTQYPQSEPKSKAQSDVTSTAPSGETDKGIMEKASDAVRRAADQARDLAEQGRDVTRLVENAPSAMRDAIDTSIKQQPMMTLAIAGALGFLLGAVWKS